MSNELNEALIEAAKIGNETIVKLLLAAGADVHAEGDSALRWASYNGHLEVVKLLLAAGADAHFRNDSALLLASQNGHSEVVKLLEAAMNPKKKQTVTFELTDEQLEKVKQFLEASSDS